MRIYYGRKHAYQDTGIELYQSQFDEKEAKKGFWKVVKKHPRQDELNKRLKSLMDRAYNVDNDLRMKGTMISAKIIKQKLKHYGKSANIVFADVIEKDRRLGENTKESYQTVITRLFAFSPDITVKEIDYQFAKDFESYLLDQPSRTGGKLEVNTVNKYLKDLYGLLKRCLKYEFIDKNKMEGYDYIPERRVMSNSRTGRKVAYKPIEDLKPVDIEKLESVDFNDFVSPAKAESLRHTADAFLFSCFTGLRLSDWMIITPAHLIKGVLVFEPIKGRENRKKELILKIPIGELFNGKGLQLFKKYSRFKLKDSPIFASRKRITHQQNIVLIRSLLFPGRKISLHSGRHTFETSLQDLGIDPFSIQKLMGHSKIETTQKYNHSEWDKVNEDIKKAFPKAN